MEKLTVVVVDDHPLMREAVRAMLAGHPEIEIVGEADSGEGALELVAAAEPAIVLLDLRLPGMDGLVCLERLRAEHPGVRVVVLSSVDEPETIGAVLRRGARAFVRKSVNPDDLAAVLRQVADESVYVAPSPGAAGPLPAEVAAGLSPKELGVLEQVALGLSNKQIAAALWVTEDTVKFHLRHIYRKLGVGSRTEAMRVAHERALVCHAA